MFGIVKLLCQCHLALVCKVAGPQCHSVSADSCESIGPADQLGPQSDISSQPPTLSPAEPSNLSGGHTTDSLTTPPLLLSQLIF